MKRKRRPQGWGRIFNRPNSRYWWLEYWFKNQQLRESTKSTDYDEADRKLDRRYFELYADGFIGVNQEKITVPELADDLVLHLEAKGAKSIPSMKSHLKPIREHFRFTRAVQLTSPNIRRFIEQRLEDGKARATVNREVGALRQAFNLARKEDRMSQIPYFPMLTEDNTREGFFEVGEFEAVIASLPDPVNDIARFGFLSGWRRGEILPLRWEAVDREGREIRLRTSKNRKGRVLPLEGDLLTLIEHRWAAREYETPDDVTRISEYVFHRKGRCLKEFRKSWATACEKAKVPGKLFHDLRRTAARDMIRAGVPESVAREITGHKTSSMFQRYNITDDRDMRNALRRTQEYQESLPKKKSNVAPFSPSEE